MSSKEIIKKARVLYNYLHLDMTVSKADLIIGFGCMDKSIPKRCAELYNNGYGRTVLFSGKVGKGTDNVLAISVAERFRLIAIEEGVPESSIMLEEKATNTYDNFRFSKQLLKDQSIMYDSVIIVQKPYVMRRCKAIADKEMADKKVYVTSCKLDFLSLIELQEKEKTMTFDDIINELVGEISIILSAPNYDLQSPQSMDDKVKKAYLFLIEKGYTRYVVREEDMKKILNK